MTGAGGFQMWAVFVLIGGALILYVLERAAMELTSLGIIGILLLFFHFFPVFDSEGASVLTSARILQGFANPALITVMALLVMGHGMIRTGVLEQGARWALTKSRGRLGPAVVIFIPILQALAVKLEKSVSKVMMPLSFAAILGGLTTLIGSSTNLLVNSALIEMGETPFRFFDFTVPGLVLAAAGFLYAVNVVPRLLPDRAGLAEVFTEGGGKQFVAQIEIAPQSDLVGQGTRAGHFSGLPEMTVRLAQRGEEAILPPFEDYTVAAGDVLVVAATREALAKALGDDPGLLHPDLGDDTRTTEDGEQRWLEGGQTLAEVMVAPASGLIGLTLPRIGFRYKTHCIVLGIQRRARMIRARVTDIRLEPGDVLLVQGQPDDISRLRHHRDVVLLEWSAEDLPALDHAKRAGFIFLTAVGLAASGVLPIVAAALVGAVAMVAAGVLTVQQAFRAIDARILTAIAAAIALSVSLQETGGAAFIADNLVGVMAGYGPAAILSLIFIVAALLTNVISNNAVAVLFTPIAVNTAIQLGLSPAPFAVAVVFAANCSFASPLGYQTNLLVMGPGHYRFTDFTRAGLPLVFLLWLVFSLFAPWYYGF